MTQQREGVGGREKAVGRDTTVKNQQHRSGVWFLQLKKEEEGKKTVSAFLSLSLNIDHILKSSELISPLIFEQLPGCCFFLVSFFVHRRQSCWSHADYWNQTLQKVKVCRSCPRLLSTTCTLLSILICETRQNCGKYVTLSGFNRDYC